METRMQRLLNEQAALRRELRGMTDTIDREGRDYTADEQTRTDEIIARLGVLGGEDGNSGEIGAERARRDAIRNTVGEPEAPAAGASRITVVDNPNPRGEMVFPTLGHQLGAIYKATVSNDFASRNLLQAAAAGANEGIDSDGGFLLQDDFSSGIERRMNEVGTLLALMNPLGVSGNALVERMITETSRAAGSRWGGIRGYWVGEGDTITDSRPKFERVKTELEKIAALGYSTDELLEDIPAMSGLFTEGFAEELVFNVEDAIIEGDGLGKPLGILNAPALVTQAKETGQAADTFVSANISNMWNRFPVRNRANAVWLINQELEPQLDVLSIPAGVGALEPRYVTYGPDGVLRIKGRPVIAVEYCSALGDLGDVILVDLSQYRLITKGGVRQASSMHVKFATDEMAFRATYRVGGQPKWRSAVTPFKATSGRTVSPYVTLAAR